MTGTDARGTWLASLAGPAGPRETEAAARWATLDPTHQRVLRRAAVDSDAARQLDTPEDRRLVLALTAVLTGRSRADVVVPVLTGLLVLSTVWGFGRAVVPAHAGAFLLGGLLGMAATTVLGWRQRARRRADARDVAAALRGPDTARP